MEFVTLAVDMFTPPNNFVIPTTNGWTIFEDNAVTLWLQLNIDDSLGIRRYVPATGSSLTVTFERSRPVALGGPFDVASDRNVVKTAVSNVDDRSLASFALTKENVNNIISGRVKFKLVEGAVTREWVQSHFVRKELISAGS